MLLILFLITIAISFICSYSIEKLFAKYSFFLDIPTKRSSHDTPTPTAGGISILLSYLIYIFLLLSFNQIFIPELDGNQEKTNKVFYILLLSLVPIIIIGLIDDFKKVNITLRLLVQFFSATIIIYFFYIGSDNNIFDVNTYSQQSSFMIILLSIMLSMWLMNLYNFMDGIDGYASVQCIFVSLSASIFAYINRSDDFMYLYILEKFSYLISEEILKGQNLLINTNYNLPTSDKFFFKSAIINLKDQSFLGNDAVIKIKKDIFDDVNNDPRIMGVSALGNKDETKISKGIFTSCKENENCTPWSIQAKEIIHDKKKKEIIYNNALLKIYDIPILYFPKFFHPDPTVNRRSGFLKPQINNSNILGNSYSIPYYSVLSENKDFTFTPFFFENNLQMFQNEYRQINKYSKLYTNFGFVNNYQSTIESNKNSIFNLFADYELDLNFEKFSSSSLFVSIERVTKDTFLKIFDTNIQDSVLTPKDYDNLKNEIKISLDNNKYFFESGMMSYENLQKNNSDRYEYVLPYYDYNTTLNYSPFDGNINFSSSGKNVLNNTNQIKSNVINNLSYNSKNFTSLKGIKSSLVLNTKNLNSVGKNNSEYKSSPQIELMNEININVSYPLLKQNKNDINYLTPRAMIKINPSDMKNYSALDITTNVDNIFSMNRLGVVDTLEAGKSLTLGLDYKKENLEDLNKYFEFKIASVLRDKEENFIPNKSTLNKKNSNLFGSISNNFSNYFNLKYNFAVNNDFNTLEYSNMSAVFNFKNLTTRLDFLEESGIMGDSNFLENNTEYKIDDKNYISFKTRRNRKLNLTEYYDLVYEYKNDCLSAGIKYKKTYYEDRDLKPSENLFFTINLIPLTNYEQKIER